MDSGGRAPDADDDGEREDDHADRGRQDSPGRHRVRVVATAPSATVWSSDEGVTWNTIDGVTGIWAVAFANERTGWLVGTNGQILKIEF